MIQAYLVEYMARQKELSADSVSKLLRTSHKQTPAEQRAAIATIAAAASLLLLVVGAFLHPDLPPKAEV